MKVAIVHDWLVNYGGAETWVEYMLRLYQMLIFILLCTTKKRWAVILPRIKFTLLIYKNFLLLRGFIQSF